MTKSALSNGFDVIFLPIFLICSVGVVANLMLLIAFVKDPLKCFRNSATYLVGSLALSDVLFSVGIAATIGLGAANRMLVFVNYFSLYSSMLAIFSIALDRYLMITFPFKHRLLMSGNKMAMWIAFIWFLSSIHPVKKVLMPSKTDNTVKSGICLFFIILTALLYGKTYFALKKQAKSMAGKKGAFPSRERKHTSKKNNSIEKETTVTNAECIETQISCAEIESFVQSGETTQLQTIRAQIQNGCTQNQDKRAQNPSKCAGNEAERVESHDGRVENEDECAQYQNEHVESRNDPWQNHKEPGENEDKRVRSQNELAQGQNYHNGTHNKPPINMNRTVSKHEEIRSQNFSTDSQKNSAVAKNAKEQKFLNTIIIIAFIAVVTTLPGLIIDQLWTMVEEKNLGSEKILSAVFWPIFCFNFAVNPFVYFLRLRRYRKTMKMVYGCKY